MADWRKTFTPDYIAQKTLLLEDDAADILQFTVSLKQLNAILFCVEQGWSWSILRAGITQGFDVESLALSHAENFFELDRDIFEEAAKARLQFSTIAN